MPLKFRDLPPDDPIFQGGVSFVFRSDLPAEQEQPDESDDVDEDAED